MILQEIKEKLLEIDPNVFYGMVDDREITKEWNYIVFMRKALGTNTNKSSYSDYFTVAIIREGFIPEGLDVAVIEKMCSIKGMRLASTDCQYNYTAKPNTNTVIELLTIEFVKPRKVDA